MLPPAQLLLKYLNFLVTNIFSCWPWKLPEEFLWLSCQRNTARNRIRALISHRRIIPSPTPSPSSKHRNFLLSSTELITGIFLVSFLWRCRLYRLLTASRSLALCLWWTHSRLFSALHMQSKLQPLSLGHQLMASHLMSILFISNTSGFPFWTWFCLYALQREHVFHPAFLCT